MKSNEAMAMEKKIIAMAQEIYEEYKKFYPDADYLKIALYKDVVIVNNEYWDRDFEHQINAYMRGSCFWSEDDRTKRLTEEEE